MSWNHRVVKSRERKTFKNGHTYDETFYAIHEVYYDKKGRPDGVTKDNVHPQGSTVAALREELVMMLRATYRPVLSYKKERK